MNYKLVSRELIQHTSNWQHQPSCYLSLLAPSASQIAWHHAEPFSLLILLPPPTWNTLSKRMPISLKWFWQVEERNGERKKEGGRKGRQTWQEIFFNTNVLTWYLFNVFFKIYEFEDVGNYFPPKAVLACANVETFKTSDCLSASFV